MRVIVFLLHCFSVAYLLQTYLRPHQDILESNGIRKNAIIFSPLLQWTSHKTFDFGMKTS